MNSKIKKVFGIWWKRWENRVGFTIKFHCYLIFIMIYVLFSTNFLVGWPYWIENYVTHTNIVHNKDCSISSLVCNSKFVIFFLNFLKEYLILIFAQWRQLKMQSIDSWVRKILWAVYSGSKISTKHVTNHR